MLFHGCTRSREEILVVIAIGVLVSMAATAILFYRLQRIHGFAWALLSAIVGFLMICGLLSASSVSTFERTPVKAVGSIIWFFIYVIVIVILMLKIDEVEQNED